MRKLSVLSTIPLVAVVVAVGWTAQEAAVQAAGPVAAQPARASAPSRALLDRYCVTCHNERLRTAGLTLDTVDVTDVVAHAEVLEKVVRKLRNGQMPPAGRPQPDAATVDAFAGALETALDASALVDPDPGRVASHRLNRLEYVNAIVDLLALEVDGEALLPSDMAGFGFDNNADVLSLTPSLLSRYIAAATKISRAAVGSPDNRPVMQVYRVGFERRDIRISEEMPFATHGGLAVRHHFPLDGDYDIAIRLKRNGTVETIDGIGENEHEIEVRVDDALVQRFTIGGKYPGPDPGRLIAVPEDDIAGAILHEYRMLADQELELRRYVEAGTHLVSVAFTDSAPSPNALSDAPGVDMVYISGPFNGTVPDDTASRRRIFVCHPESPAAEAPCAREILSSLARRAYRRPVTAADVDPLMRIYGEGRRERDFDFGVERGVEALLSMPKFLLRVEAEPVDLQAGAVYELSDLELASRLSFFLWKSVPDDALIDLASRGALSEPAVLRQQVERMLADRRATRFLNDFVGQWLQVRNIYSQAPDGALFAGFNDTLRQGMVRETELFFESQVRADRPIPELLRADYTYLNEQLAEHYGVSGVYGPRFRRHTWAGDDRQGLLGHASLLTVTSYANRTSVVLRGKWVLENLLGAPPPPPPPNVPPLEEQDQSAPTSLRDRMEQHRANPVCAACHATMDPLGFAMEHFDAVGKWRDTDGGAEINSTIELAGTTVDSPRAFREALLNKGDQFIRTVAEKMFSYALGRGVNYTDAPTVRGLVRELQQHDNRWSSLVLGIVTSDPFQKRRVPVAPSTVVADGQQ